MVHEKQKEAIMVKTALFVRLEAKPGKESEVEDFLRGGACGSHGGASHDRLVCDPFWAVDIRHL